jgi:hypothetical protein
MSDLERELEQELHRVLDPLAAGPIPGRRQIQAHGLSRALFGGAGAALGVKLLTGVAVAAAAVTVAGVSTTGSLNPVNWGQMVQEQVESCKLQLQTGQHGIGDCVSDFANQHGQAVASDARHHGNPNPHSNNGNTSGNGNGNGNGNASGHAKDKTPPKGPPSKP